MKPKLRLIDMTFALNDPARVTTDETADAVTAFATADNVAQHVRDRYLESYFFDLIINAWIDGYLTDWSYIFPVHKAGYLMSVRVNVPKVVAKLEQWYPPLRNNLHFRNIYRQWLRETCPAYIGRRRYAQILEFNVLDAARDIPDCLNEHKMLRELEHTWGKDRPVGDYENIFGA